MSGNPFRLASSLTNSLRRSASAAVISALTGTALLAGCAGGGLPGLGGGGGGSAATSSPAPTTLPDLSSTDGVGAPTAVVETVYTIDGAIMPVTRGQSRQGTRADMRRSDSLVTFDNWMLRKVAGDGQHADIVRVDRKLVWTLQPARQTYTECPLTGCTTAAGKPADDKDKPASEPAKAREPDCPVTVKSNDLKVSSSGERKVVNGFSTERFQIGWTIDIEDRNGRHNLNKVLLDMWTTPETGAVKDVQAINDAYQRRYVSAITAGGDNPFGRYLPREVLTAMSALMKNANTRDAKTLAAWANEMKKVRGYPISMLATWNSEGSVCGDSSTAQGGAPMPTLSGLLGGLTGKTDNSPAAGGAPLISYAYEVKTLAVKTVSDSNFVPPPQYQRSNQP